MVPDGLRSVAIESNEALERFCVVAIVGVVRKCEREIALHPAGFRIMQPDLNQLIRVAYALRRAQQERIHKREHRGVHSNSQC